MKYRVWNIRDEHKHFMIEADSDEDALHAALEELGWNIDECNDEVLDELAEIAQKHNMGY